jgi:hypothetical protein
MFNHYLKTGLKPVSTMDRQVDNILSAASTPSSDCFPDMRISFPSQSAKGHAFQRHQMEIAFLMLFQ